MDNNLDYNALPPNLKNTAIVTNGNGEKILQPVMINKYLNSEGQTVLVFLTPNNETFEKILE